MRRTVARGASEASEPASATLSTIGAADRGHPCAAVDVVLLRFLVDSLETLIVKIRRGPLRGRWAFPGGRVRRGEPLDEAARREIRDHTPSRDVYVEQLFTFGEPARDPMAHVISTAYLGLLTTNEPTALSSTKYSERAWMDVRRLPSLAYDHDHVARVALERLRAKISHTNLAYALLPPEFTMAELQLLYERILERPFDRRNFRKKLLASGLLVALSRQRLGAHRPAALYAFRDRRPRWLAGI